MLFRVLRYKFDCWNVNYHMKTKVVIYSYDSLKLNAGMDFGESVSISWFLNKSNLIHRRLVPRVHISASCCCVVVTVIVLRGYCVFSSPCCCFFPFIFILITWLVVHLCSIPLMICRFGLKARVFQFDKQILSVEYIIVDHKKTQSAFSFPNLLSHYKCDFFPLLAGTLVLPSLLSLMSSRKVGLGLLPLTLMILMSKTMKKLLIVCKIELFYWNKYVYPQNSYINLLSPLYKLFIVFLLLEVV